MSFTQVPPPSSFEVPTGTCPDSRIAEHLMVADFETAVDCCLAENRFADAFIIARIGGEELLQRTIDTYRIGFPRVDRISTCQGIQKKNIFLVRLKNYSEIYQNFRIFENF